MRTVLFSLLSLLSLGILAQGTGYFQQDVSYKITGTLDDVNHILHAEMEMTYTNNSPDTLTELYFHVWPRAFSGPGTAFDRQQLRNGSTRFHFAEEGRRGTLDSLNFRVDGETVDWAYDETHPDIALIKLARHLRPRQTITLRTPFRVQIPASWSRLGHVGTSYQMTQWYPKPAVYDAAGWHPMPYLDQGEFYSEFGDYEVSITLPENYTVGATGTLQNEAERRRLLEKADTDRQQMQALGMGVASVDLAFPPSSPTTKTLTWKAERVHDFAWFADKRFYVLHDTLAVPGGETIDVWSMFTNEEANLWKESITYLKEATKFYSEQVGPYPYPQVTGVQSALSAGGGMEYPMITVIGRSGNAKSLDEVLAHEVGHNWFYGILASNERDHAWMDEGLNSYYERRYMEARYPDDRTGFDIPVLGNVDQNLIGYRLLARTGRNQAPDTRADSLTLWNYFTQSYATPALALFELENVVGRTAVDRAMQAYYRKYQFRHPQPADFFRVMRENIEEEIEPWFPAALLTDATSDWSGVAARKATPKHRGARVPPVMDDLETGPLDLYPTNDGQRRSPKLGLLTAGEDPAAWQVFAAPWAGYNIHDGFFAGAVLHNRTVEPRRLEWALAPAYAFGSGSMVGFAGLQSRWLRPVAGTQQLLLTAEARRFHAFTLDTMDIEYDYRRYELGARLLLDHPAIKQVESEFFGEVIRLDQDRADGFVDGFPTDEITRTNHFVRLGYRRRHTDELRPSYWSAVLEYKDRDTTRGEAFEDTHLRLDLTYGGGVQYDEGFFVRYRAYGGYFLSNGLRESSSNPASALSLVDNADTDYRFDRMYLGRNSASTGSSWAGQQSELLQGGFRAPIGAGFPFGRSNNYLVAGNVDIDLPFTLGFVQPGAYLDVGFYGSRTLRDEPETGEFAWVGGASLSVLDGAVGIYAPLIANPNTRDLIDQRGNFVERLVFRLSLHRFLPWKVLEQVP